MVYYSDPQYLDKGFPFNMYENCIPDAASSLIDADGNYPAQFRMHNHDCLELNYISSGEGIYYIGEETHPFKRGDVLIFNNYEYKHFVASKGLLKYHTKELREVFFRRFDEHGDYYTSCEPVLTTFTFFKKVVDNWYPDTLTITLSRSNR